MDCSPQGFSVHGILQTGILEWIAVPSSRGSSGTRDWTHISCVSCISRQILYHWATWEALSYPSLSLNPLGPSLKHLEYDLGFHPGMVDSAFRLQCFILPRSIVLYCVVFRDLIFTLSVALRPRMSSLIKYRKISWGSRKTACWRGMKRALVWESKDRNWSPSSGAEELCELK